MALLPAVAAAQSFVGQVQRVVDSDTVIDEDPLGTWEKLRLQAIDCPETKGQPFGNAAKKFTSALIVGKKVEVSWEERDRYGRILGWVFTPDGRNVNYELVRAGLAWHYVRYSENKELARLEDTARRQRIGLWEQTDLSPPWKWRRRER